MVEFKRKSLELLYDAKIVALYKDVLETPDGGEVVYDLIKHKSGGGAGILLVDEEEYTYLVRQYRNSLDAVDLEIPAGLQKVALEADVDRVSVPASVLEITSTLKV